MDVTAGGIAIRAQASVCYLASDQMGSTSRLYAVWHSSAQDRYAASAAATKPR